MNVKETTNEQLEFVVTLLFGMLGGHKFMKKDFKMGFIYLFTAGLFGIGWIIDVVKCLGKITMNGVSKYDSLMGQEGIDAINSGKMPNIQGTNLNLATGEICCYMDKAYTFSDKTITTGYTGKRNGVSIRIAKGISYHTGGSGSQAIRETQRTTYHGILYITTKRVIFTSGKESFDKVFDKITSIQEVQDGLIIQIGSNTYSIVTKTHKEFMKVFNLIKDTQENNVVPNIMGLSSTNKEVIYEKMIDVVRTNTEGRQNLIKQLIKNDEFLKEKEYFQNDRICCDADLEESKMPSGKRCINVVVKREGSQYNYQVGYVPESIEKELQEEIKKAGGYSIDLFVSTEDDGKYSLKVKVKMYKL